MTNDPMPTRRTPPSTYAISALIAIVLVAWACRTVHQLHDTAAESTSSGKLCYLGGAMHIYNEVHGRLPGPNAPGRETPRDGPQYPVSWRVRILPYIEEQKLFDEYRFDEPWDGPHNEQLTIRMPKVFRHPKADVLGDPVGHTHYRVFVSRPGAKPSALFTDGLRGPTLNEIADGTSYTIMIAEATEAVPWTMPEGLVFDPDAQLPKIGGLFPKSTRVLMVNSAGQSFRSGMPDDKLRAWITKDGGDIPDGE